MPDYPKGLSRSGQLREASAASWAHQFSGLTEVRDLKELTLCEVLDNINRREVIRALDILCQRTPSHVFALAPIYVSQGVTLAGHRVNSRLDMLGRLVMGSSRSFCSPTQDPLKN